MYDNIEKNQIISLAAQVDYVSGKTNTKLLARNDLFLMVLIAFDKNTQIPAHCAEGEGLVTVLEGTGCITIADHEHLLKAGDSIVMPANVPHAQHAVERFKMLLIALNQ